MDPLFREAKKRFLETQSEDWKSQYFVRAKELNDGKIHYLEREEMLNEEFGIDRTLLTKTIEEVRVEWKEKKAKKRESKASLPPEASSPEQETAQRGGLIASNDVSNVKWVADNLPNDGASREDAPSTAAWGMLCWARRNPDQFYTQIYKQIVIPTKREIEEASDAIDDEEKLIGALDRVRAIASEVIEQ